MAGLHLALAAAAAASPLSVEKPTELISIRRPNVVITYEGTSFPFPSALDLSFIDEVGTEELVSRLQDQAPDSDFSVLHDGDWVSVVWSPVDDRLLDRTVTLPAGEIALVDFADLLESALQATQGPEERPLGSVSVGTGSVQRVNPQVRVPAGPLAVRDLLKKLEVLPPPHVVADPAREAEYLASIRWLLRDNGERQGISLAVLNRTPPKVPDDEWAPWTGGPDLSRKAFLEQVIAMIQDDLSDQSAERQAQSLARIQALEDELELLSASEDQ